MIVKINKNGYLQSPYISDADIDIEIDTETFNEISAFPNFTNWRYINEKWVLEEILTPDIIRSRRYKECFIFINRGDLWYKHLSNEQKEELDIWYQAWLDAPETKVIPTKPEWLE